MKKNILFVLPLCLLSIACPQQDAIQPMGDSVQPMDCQSMTIPAKCTGSSENPKIIINVESSGLTAKPPNVCTHAGKDIEVTVTPINTKVTVVTVPKKPANTWIAGINRPNPVFDMEVPPSAAIDDTFHYYVVGTNGYCYDPKITVN